jgi:hypothetical protein
VTVANHAELISFKGFGKTFVAKAGDLRAATDIVLAIRRVRDPGRAVRLREVALLNAAAGLFPPTNATKGSIEMLGQQS